MILWAILNGFVQIFHHSGFLDTLIGHVLCMYDPSKINGSDVIEYSNPIFEPKKRSLCTKVKDLKLTWYHADNTMNL